MNVSRRPLVWTGAMMAIHATDDAGGRALGKRQELDSPGASWIRTLAAGDLDRAYRLAGFILTDGVEAEDATQDALRRAWEQRATLRSIDAAQAWFDRILVNVCRDRVRRRARIRWLTLDEHAPATADLFARAIDGDETLRGIATLDADHRIVVVLRFWADLPIDAIADRVGVPAGTVKSRLHYALGALRRTLETPERTR